MNTWQLRISDGHAVYFDCKKQSQLCADRKFLIEHYRRRVSLIEKNGFKREGTLRNYKFYEGKPHNIEMFGTIPEDRA